MDNLNKRLEDVKTGRSKFNKKSFVKFGLIFLAIVAAVVVFFPIIREKYQARSMNKFFNDYFKWEEDYKNALKNDTYGGKTPQETYEMFIDALKKGDIIGAARFSYATDEGRIRMYKQLKLAQDKGILSSWISGLPKWEDFREVEISQNYGEEKRFETEYYLDEPYYFYMGLSKTKTEISSGKHVGAIIFAKNKIADIWKIDTFWKINILNEAE